MENGRIEWYSATKGFGIITSTSPEGIVERYFLHITKIVKAPETIKAGQHCTFQISTAPVKEAQLRMVFNVTVESDVKAVA
jgi:cold shock CspA family protein